MERILIIKLGSMGDVLRTTPLLRGLKEKYPFSQISWLTYCESVPILEGNTLINRLYSFDLRDTLVLQAEEFDLLINLDKDPEALAIASLMNSKKKMGYAMGVNGNIIALNPATEYSIRLGFDDDLKFHQNRKTYPEMIFEIAELPFDLKKEYVFDLPQKNILFSHKYLQENKVEEEDVLIGINTGAGRRFVNKNLSEAQIAFLANKFLNNLAAKVILLGGPLEILTNQRIKKLARRDVLDSGYLELKDFAALVNRCNLLICADTLTMHLAIALEKPVIAIFGPTCAQEIELYNRGVKIISPIECSPCYQNTCLKKPNCMDMINPDEIFNKVLNLLNKFIHTKI